MSSKLFGYNDAVYGIPIQYDNIDTIRLANYLETVAQQDMRVMFPNGTPCTIELVMRIEEATEKHIAAYLAELCNDNCITAYGADGNCVDDDVGAADVPVVGIGSQLMLPWDISNAEKFDSHWANMTEDDIRSKITSIFENFLRQVPDFQVHVMSFVTNV